MGFLLTLDDGRVEWVDDDAQTTDAPPDVKEEPAAQDEAQEVQDLPIDDAPDVQTPFEPVKAAAAPARLADPEVAVDEASSECKHAAVAAAQKGFLGDPLTADIVKGLNTAVSTESQAVSLDV